MEVLTALFGEGKDLSSWQMGMRAATTFVAALIFIRISGRRSFGQRSPFDYVVAILLGATMSRAIVGASPAIPTFVASLVIVFMHRALAWGCVRSHALEVLVGDLERQLYRDGIFDRQQMLAALVSRTDILETVRKELGTDALDKVQSAILERNGEIAFFENRTHGSDKKRCETGFQLSSSPNAFSSSLSGFRQSHSELAYACPVHCASLSNYLDESRRNIMIRFNSVRSAGLTRQ